MGPRTRRRHSLGQQHIHRRRRLRARLIVTSNSKRRQDSESVLSRCCLTLSKSSRTRSASLTFCEYLSETAPLPRSRCREVSSHFNSILIRCSMTTKTIGAVQTTTLAGSLATAGETVGAERRTVLSSLPVQTVAIRVWGRRQRKRCLKSMMGYGGAGSGGPTGPFLSSLTTFTCCPRRSPVRPVHQHRQGVSWPARLSKCRSFLIRWDKKPSNDLAPLDLTRALIVHGQDIGAVPSETAVRVSAEPMARKGSRTPG